MSSPIYPHNTAGAGPSNPSTSRSSRTYYRPASIAELAAQAQENLWDPSLGLKHWLRTAEKARRTAESLIQAHDYEAAFVEYAKAATIVLEKLPSHREYQTLLNADQRSNLGMNGQDILDSLSQLKPILVERYEQWQASQGTTPGSSRASSTDPGLSREEERAREAREAARREEIWKQEEYVRRQAEERERQARAELAWRHSGEAKREDVGARRAAEARALAETERASMAERQRREEEQRRTQASESRREEDRSKWRAADERRMQEQDGIARRQQEAEAAARAARRDIVRLTPSPVGASSYRPSPGDAGSRNPPHQVYAPQPSRPPPPSQQSSFTDPYGTGSTVPVMPLESPNKCDDDSSTDAEGSEQTHSSRSQRNDQTPKGKPIVPGAMPNSLLTTTSPPPPELGSIKYPSLMSQHQLKQGYAPSLQSMFANTHISKTPKADLSLLFDHKQPTSNGPYPSFPHKPEPAPVIPPYPTNMPVPDVRRPPSAYAHQHTSSHGSMRGPSPNGSRAPPYPSPVKDVSHRSTASTSSSSSRIVPGSTRDAQVQELRTIKLPRECLSRFLSIARVNTLQNRETCGLLLGKDRGNKYVVTTLLIPKQHSTSDTCMMDEEELVLQFTEERHLITLGWIHTHPTQSCFMSSVDLHTHSGFQRMLPESFAVVCAPSSTPQFGIFRLTDPGGLQTILECNAKEAFHPHPEVPIYTDCDNCHVQMKDMPLEIVDLR